MESSTGTGHAAVTVDLTRSSPRVRLLTDLLRHGLRAHGLEVLDAGPSAPGRAPGGTPLRHRVRATVVAAGGGEAPRRTAPGRPGPSPAVVISPGRERRLVDAAGGPGTDAVFVSLQVVDGLAGLARLLADVAGSPGGRHADVQLRLPLTDSQVAVARLVAAGHGNRSIAAARHTSESAVRNMVSRILDRLGIASSDGSNARVLLARAIADAEGRGLAMGALSGSGWG